jgi:hypothetical protein
VQGSFGSHISRAGGCVKLQQSLVGLAAIDDAVNGVKKSSPSGKTQLTAFLRVGEQAYFIFVRRGNLICQWTGPR